MPAHVAKSTSVSSHRRRQHLLGATAPPPVAVLDLDKPAERQAHEFLLRATSKHDPFWKLLDMRRQGSTLLCVVRWFYPTDARKPFALVEVSLTMTAVCWRYYPTADAARAEMEQQCADTQPQSLASR